MSLLLEPSLVSRGRAALVSAEAVAEDDDSSVKGGAGVKAGGESLSSSSQAWLWSSLSCSGGKYKGGGHGDSSGVVRDPGSWEDAVTV